MLNKLNQGRATAPQYPNTMDLRTCPVCGKKFAGTTNKKYCSPKCARDAGTEKNYGYIRKRSAIKAKQNPDLLIAFDFKCAVCGWHLPANGHNHQRGCAFHHIVPVCEGGANTEENLILLCPNCHTMAHAGYITRETLLGLTFTSEQVAEKAREFDFLAKVQGATILDELF